jgi:hypothetical protein
MPITELSPGEKYDVTCKLILHRESFLSDIPAGTGISKSFFYGEASPLVFAIQPISKTLTILFDIHRVHEILLDHVTIQNKRGTKILDFHSVSNFFLCSYGEKA